MSRYEELLEDFEAYTRSAGGVKSLMQHMAERLHEGTTRYNWVGFYLMEEPANDALVLGPYVGSFMPTLRIPLDRGLCGAAATTGKTVVVNNVAADPRYLGSDLVKSNMVAPIFVKSRVVAETVHRELLCRTLSRRQNRNSSNPAPPWLDGIWKQIPDSRFEVGHTVPYQLHRNREDQKPENAVDRANRSRPKAFDERTAETQEQITGQSQRCDSNHHA